MKAVVAERLGAAPVYGEVDEPVAADGMVVATVRAVAVKNIERALVAGTHYASGRLAPPAGVGVDAVVTLPDGRRAYTGTTPPAGTMAERIAVKPGLTVEIPEGVDDASAAALPNAGVSAWFALEYAGAIRAGQTVLVLGATGVTGSLAVQLAKHRFGAARVVAAGRDADRLERLRGLGADETLRLGGPGNVEDEVRRLHAAHPFDLVLDYLWGPPAEGALRALANDDMAAEFHRTRYVQIGEMAGPDITLPAGVLRSAGVELLGQGGGSVPRESFARVMPEILPALFTMLANDDLTVDTVTRPMPEVHEAWTTQIPSGARLVLTP